MLTSDSDYYSSRNLIVYGAAQVFNPARQRPMKPVYMYMALQLLLLVAFANGQPVPELAPAESMPPPAIASPDPTYSPTSAVAPDPSTSGYAEGDL